MTLILGDIKWLTDNIHKFDKNAEVVVMVSDGVKAIELPVSSVTMDKKLVITCQLPLEETLPTKVKQDANDSAKLQ